MTSRPAASAVKVSKVAAALLLTTHAASAPVSDESCRSAWTSRRPRVPASMSYSRFEYRRHDPPHGVDSAVPERCAAKVRMQDHAGSVDQRPQRRALLRAQPVGHGSLDRTGDIGFGFPRASRARSASASTRSAVTTWPRPNSFSRTSMAARWRSCSIEGISRSRLEAISYQPSAISYQPDLWKAES